MTKLLLEAIVFFFLVYPFAHMALLLKNPPDSRSGRFLEGLFLCVWAVSIVGLIYLIGHKVDSGELAMRAQAIATVDVLGLLYTIIILAIGGAMMFHATVMIPSDTESTLRADIAQRWHVCPERCAFRYAFIAVFLLGMAAFALLNAL